MDLVLIGIYEDYAHALSAKHELLASGFSRRDVQLNPDHELSETDAPGGVPGVDAESGSRIGGLFGAMFQTENKSTYSNVYADAVRRGNAVVTVDVHSDEGQIRAMQIIHNHGAFEIEERSTDWMWHGWRGHNPGEGR